MYIVGKSRPFWSVSRVGPLSVGLHYCTFKHLAGCTDADKSHPLSIALVLPALSLSFPITNTHTLNKNRDPTEWTSDWLHTLNQRLKGAWSIHRRVTGIKQNMGRAATTFFKRLASMVAEKRYLPYAAILNWIRCRLSFALLYKSQHQTMCTLLTQDPGNKSV